MLKCGHQKQPRREWKVGSHSHHSFLCSFTAVDRGRGASAERMKQNIRTFLVQLPGLPYLVFYDLLSPCSCSTEGRRCPHEGKQQWVPPYSRRPRRVTSQASYCRCRFRSFLIREECSSEAMVHVSVSWRKQESDLCSQPEGSTIC
jgi:hypothetical protein